MLQSPKLVRLFLPRLTLLSRSALAKQLGVAPKKIDQLVSSGAIATLPGANLFVYEQVLERLNGAAAKAVVVTLSPLDKWMQGRGQG